MCVCVCGDSHSSEGNINVEENAAFSKTIKRILFFPPSTFNFVKLNKCGFVGVLVSRHIQQAAHMGLNQDF